MTVDHPSPTPVERPYERPTLTALGTLAELTRGLPMGFTDDGLGGSDASGDDGSLG